MEALSDDTSEQYQERILPAVSRTFALTIPQLPARLRRAVTNGYLLCRIADTIEDEAALSAVQKQYFHERFVAVTDGCGQAEPFARELVPLLTRSALPAERELVGNTPVVITVMRSLSERQQQALAGCVRAMCRGMPEFQRNTTTDGVRDMAEMDRYCYYVAGVVGEMLTELFCDYSPDIERHRTALRQLSVSFGQGLQMTNILKDIWSDRERGVCWLPRELFRRYGFELAQLAPARHDRNFERGLMVLVGIAHRHLRNALSYTLLIPDRERGIRRFCLWAIGLAALTLKNICTHPGFNSGQEVKVSRRTVRYTACATSVLARHDKLLRYWFNWTAKRLPLAADRASPDEAMAELGAGASNQSFTHLSGSQGRQEP